MRSLIGLYFKKYKKDETFSDFFSVIGVSTAQAKRERKADTPQASQADGHGRRASAGRTDGNALHHARGQIAEKRNGQPQAQA